MRRKTDCRHCGTFLEEGINWRATTLKRICTACLSDERKQWYEDNKERIKESTKKFRNENPNVIMYQRVKGRAKREGLSFDLELSDIIIPEKCPVFDVPFVIGEKSPWNPSLDRIIPEKGYTKGNVIVVSVRANTIKNDASVDDLQKVFEFYASRQR